MLSKRCGINPDNVATPIAASLGDLTTLALLSTISSFFYNRIGKWSNYFIFSKVILHFCSKILSTFLGMI